MGQVLRTNAPTYAHGESRRGASSASSGSRRTRRAVSGVHSPTKSRFLGQSPRNDMRGYLGFGEFVWAKANFQWAIWACAGAVRSGFALELPSALQSNVAKISGISKMARLSSLATFPRNSASAAGSSIWRTPLTTSRKLFSTIPTRFSRTHSAL